MQIIRNQVTVPCPYDFSKKYPLEKLLFFDIETTGLSADVSSVYLIGCIYFEQGSFHLIQWFSDEYHEEQALLEAFFAFSADFLALLHYNGSGFDIPYLEKKCRQYHLDYDFSHLESIDLYKRFLPFKKVLNLTSIKQKKVEELFGLYRKDPFSGGELIKIYVDYIHGKILKEKPDLSEERKNALLLHNQEDLTGLLQITPILSFEDLTLSEPEITACTFQEDFLTLEAELPSFLPVELSLEREGWHFHGSKDTGVMTIQVSGNQFRLYYDNYKDYFYLPAEDMAVHKSVAAFVDKEYRRRATRENCYTKVTVTDELLQDKKQLAQCFQKLLAHYIHLK